MKCNLCGKTMRYSRGEGRCVRCEDDSLFDTVVDVAVDVALGVGIISLLDSFDNGPSLGDDSFSGGGGDFGGGGSSGDW